MYLLFILLFATSVWGQSLDQTYINYYNPLTNGVTCTSTTLQAALTAIGATEKTLYLTATDRNKVACTWNITSNIIIPENIRLQVPLGVNVVIAAGTSLKVEGCVDADISTWYSGAGAVTATSCDKDPAQWMGASRSYIQAGCLHNPIGSTTVTMPPCVAWIMNTSKSMWGLELVEESTNQEILLNGGDGTYWHILRLDTKVTPSGWTCSGGTRHCWVKGTDKPAIPANTIVLSTSLVTTGQVMEVGDYRVDNPTLGASAMLTSRMFGGIGDCVADNTAAIQNWINNMGWRQLPGLAPAGCYVFDSVWLHHHAVNNPRYPADVVKQGNYTLSGQGSMNVSHVNMPLQRIPGTIFVSTATSVPAFNAYAPVGQGQPNILRGLRLKHFSLKQSSLSAVINVEGAHTNSLMEDIFIHQGGLGNGVEWKNTFHMEFRHIFVYSDNLLNTGIGFWLANIGPQGGLINAMNVTGRGFGSVCVRIGAPNGVGTRLLGPNLIGVQGRTCPIGIQFMASVSGATCSGCYTEDTKQYGVEISQGVYGLSIDGGFFDGTGHTDPTDAVIKIGGETGTVADRAWGISIRGARIIEGHVGYGIWRSFSNEVNGTSLISNSFDAPSTGGYSGRGIYCGASATTTQNNLMIMANDFDIDHPITTGVDPGCRNGEVVQDSIAVWIGRRVNLGQGLIIISEPTIQLPTNGNIYNLTGVGTVTNILCGQCLPGATLSFFTQGGVGNAPKIDEDLAIGNILLVDGQPDPWIALDTEKWVISFMFDGTKWRETGRVKIGTT